jgi:RES domain-containing protein
LSKLVTLWRITVDTPDYQSDDLTGKGAELNGGRWNPKGVPVVYASGSQALACLEALVHINVPLPLNRYLVRIDVPSEAWSERTVFDPNTGIDWDAEPAGQVSIDWGAAWLSGGKSLLAAVPSIVVPDEANVLINPKHPDLLRVKATKVRKWLFDPRLRG